MMNHSYKSIKFCTFLTTKQYANFIKFEHNKYMDCVYYIINFNVSSIFLNDCNKNKLIQAL